MKRHGLQDEQPDPRPGRLLRLREEFAGLGINAFLLPVADPHQGYPLADHDRRVEWLTGFTGSAGLAAVAESAAVLFVDGRYAIQARSEAGPDDFQVGGFKYSRIREWISEHVPPGGTIGIDPWLHSDLNAEELKTQLPDWTIVCVENPVDRIWDDQPPPPRSGMFEHEQVHAGQSRDSKIAQLSEFLAGRNLGSAILTSSESIAWLLNLRGSDIARNPVKHAFATVSRQGGVTLCVNLPAGSGRHGWLGKRVGLRPLGEFSQVIDALEGRVYVPDTAIRWVVEHLAETGREICRGPDPCALPKAQKNSVQIDGFFRAHERDGAAVTEFLAWLDSAARTDSVTETSAAGKLLEFRRETGCLHDISFDTISAAGPNASIVHYRASPETSRGLRDGDLYLVDSGGQYRDGTTDVTRTVPIGRPSPLHSRNYTLALMGLIALSTARWPEGAEGRDLDVIARQFLWREQLDYAHGTGHGVGHFLSVHEGPVNISRRSEGPLRKGMVLSIEPGCYVSGEFGIRLENLAVVRECESARSGQVQRFLEFETMTLVPFDRRLIETGLLPAQQTAWLNRYHARVWTVLRPLCSPSARNWLEWACAPLG